MAAVLCVSLATTANASSVRSSSGTYTVTITESSYGEQYTAYKIFDLTYSKTDESAVAYSIDTNTANGAAWYRYLLSAAMSEHPFVFENVNNTGIYNVGWNEEEYDLSDHTSDEANKYLASFFKVAAAAIRSGELYVDQAVVNPGGDDPYTATALSTLTSAGYPDVESETGYAAKLVFEEPGYYLIVSSLGSAVMVVSTDGTAVTLSEKNDIPRLEKEETVWDDNIQDWVTKDTVNIGDILEFEVFIENVYGQTKLELHDHMSAGLFLEYDDSVSVDDVDIHTVRVYYGDVPEEIEYGNGSIYDEGVQESIDWTLMHPGNEYEIVLNAWDEETGDNDTFELVFNEEFLTSGAITDRTVFRVVYYAEVTGSGFNEEYQDVENNYAFVSYGMFGRTDFVYTYAESYGFDLQKADSEWLIGGQQFDEGYESHLLAGAEFELYHAEEVYDDLTDPTHESPTYVAGEQVRFVHTDDLIVDTEGNEHPSDGYRVADEEDDEADITTTIVIEDGEVSIYGIAAGSYILRETKAPEGYVLPDEDILIQIIEEDVQVDESNVTVVERIYVNGVEITDEEHSKVVISNEAGDILPETGGIGTAIFTITGLALIGCAGGLLYRNRRRRARAWSL